MLYIGLSGHINAGKDTVAKALWIILNAGTDFSDEDRIRLREEYIDFAENTRFATMNKAATNDDRCTCIAFADQLKELCGKMFGIGTDRFYTNKENSWICINKDFEYTELMPDPSSIITAEDFYDGYDKYSNDDKKYWMSLREILIYVGTYVCRRSINNNIFVNIVGNVIDCRAKKNPGLKWVICTDVRFESEMDFIHNSKQGLMVNIIRANNGVQDNIAEHSLDNVSEDEYDYTIFNSGDGYGKIFDTVWDMVSSNPVFWDTIIPLEGRTKDNPNYLRVFNTFTTPDGHDGLICRLCAKIGIPKMVGIRYDKDGSIGYIDPECGPIITVGDELISGYIVEGIQYYETSGAHIIKLVHRPVSEEIH